MCVAKCKTVKLEFVFIYLGLQEIELEGVEWIDLAHGREKWLALLNTVMTLEVEKMREMY
jgi:hypothetical protein